MYGRRAMAGRRIVPVGGISVRASIEFTYVAKDRMKLSLSKQLCLWPFEDSVAQAMASLAVIWSVRLASRNVMNSLSRRSCLRSLYPRARRRSMYSRRSFRRSLIGHLLATAERGFATHESPPLRRSVLYPPSGDATLHRFRAKMLLARASPLPTYGGTDSRLSAQKRCRPCSGHGLPS